MMMTDQISVTNDLCTSIDAKLVQLAEAQETVTILQKQLTEARDKLAGLRRKRTTAKVKPNGKPCKRVRRTKAQIARMSDGQEAGEP